MKTLLFLPFVSLPIVAAHEETVSWNPFIFIFFPLIFYLLIVASAYNQLRPRFPFFLVLLAIFFPPLFFSILMYIFCVFLIVAPLEPIEVQEPTRRRISRDEIRNRV